MGYASLCGQLEKDASEDQQAHSSRQAARAAGDKQQGLKQLSRRTSEAAHGKTSAAARSSTEDATGAAPTAAAPPRDAPIVAALMTAKTESDVAQALDEAARTTAAATGMHAAPTKAAAEPKNYLVCAAAKPRRRQSRPRGRRGYGKRQWRRRQLEDSRNAEASAAMVKHGVAAAAVVEDEQEADSRVTLRQLKQSIAEIDKIAKKIKGRLSGAKAREFAEMVERARSAERRIMEARQNVASQSAVAELAHDEVCNRQSSMRGSCMHGVNVREVAECREQEEMKLRKCEQENEEAKVKAVNMRLEWAETLATYEEGAAGEKTAIASGSAVLPLVLAAGWLAFIMMIARSGVGPWALIATSAAVAGIATVALVLCKVTIWSLKAEEVSQESDFVAANVEQKTKRKPTARTLIGKDSMLRAQTDLLDAKLKEVGLE